MWPVIAEFFEFLELFVLLKSGRMILISSWIEKKEPSFEGLFLEF